MTQRTFISIVTPTMNRRELLKRTIDSVRGQTFADYEHIVVDGGSTDGTPEMLAALEDSYPMRWISEPDSGMYNAVNKGFAMASGEILAYLNSDDLYFPWTLEVVARALRQQPSADLVYGDVLSIDDDSGVRRMYWQPPFHADTVRRTGFMAQPAVFWRRRVHDVLGGFDESLRYVADCDFWMRAADRFEFRKIHEVIAVEREHEGTLRETQAGVWDELREVRGRYVELDGWSNDVRHQRNRRRSQIIERLYSLMILVQSRLPRFPSVDAMAPVPWRG